MTYKRTGNASSSTRTVFWFWPRTSRACQSVCSSVSQCLARYSSWREEWNAVQRKQCFGPLRASRADVESDIDFPSTESNFLLAARTPPQNARRKRRRFISAAQFGVISPTRARRRSRPQSLIHFGEVVMAGSFH